MWWLGPPTWQEDELQLRGSIMVWKWRRPSQLQSSRSQEHVRIFTLISAPLPIPHLATEWISWSVVRQWWRSRFSISDLDRGSRTFTDLTLVLIAQKLCDRQRRKLVDRKGGRKKESKMDGETAGCTERCMLGGDRDKARYIEQIPSFLLGLFNASF